MPEENGSKDKDQNKTPHISFMMGVQHPGLTDEQESHIASIAKTFSMEMAKKYTKGQQEHGGNLWEVPMERLLDFAIEEAIDQFVYLTTIRDVLRKRHVTDGPRPRSSGL